MRILALYTPFQELIAQHESSPGDPATGVVDLNDEDFEEAQNGVRSAVETANRKLLKDSRLRPHEKRNSFRFSIYTDGITYILENL